ncbi:hypothetical protein FALBO_3055 [Fusarium albosuccineum]|uniref:Uncharacterized protein n=1 Tax=Fusarium albosuccineum TaxID=1237068 RepID=A0A8H4PHG4_9HYPO|nr:hypothetical protein FALBO_3055 [Fusarium albosuccineum]
MTQGNVHESTPEPVYRPSFVDRPPKKRQRTASPDTHNRRCSIVPPDMSLLPPFRQPIEAWLRLSLDGQQEIGQLTDVDRPAKRLFQPSLIRANITKATEEFPIERDQAVFAADNPLIEMLRFLICNRSVPCALCAFYEWGPIVYTHKLKRCSHRAEAKDVQPWLDMFRDYQARGSGPGARCSHCRFPAMLCYRTIYREEMDSKYGNETEAREECNLWYDEVQCSWVKMMQYFVTSCMVVHGKVPGTGVSQLGATVLEMMGWEDWTGLEANGPECLRSWLEEMNDIRGLRCPRLLKLFYFLAEGTQ